MELLQEVHCITEPLQEKGREKEKGGRGRVDPGREGQRGKEGRKGGGKEKGGKKEEMEEEGTRKEHHEIFSPHEKI